jgi:hypothetical protein
VRPPQLTDPAELNTLSAPELVSRVYPILWKGGLTANPQRFARIRENVPSVLAELASDWRRSPQLNDRRVRFDEYVVVRLCAALHELDQHQNPHLYDHHRIYHPKRETLSFAEGEEPIQEEVLPVARRPLDPALALLAKHTTPNERLQHALTNMGVHPASQPGVWQARDKFNKGEITKPYGLTRALGGTREQARSTPATAAFIRLEVLRDDTTFEL